MPGAPKLPSLGGTIPIAGVETATTPASADPKATPAERPERAAATTPAKAPKSPLAALGSTLPSEAIAAAMAQAAPVKAPPTPRTTATTPVAMQVVVSAAVQAEARALAERHAQSAAGATAERARTVEPADDSEPTGTPPAIPSLTSPEAPPPSDPDRESEPGPAKRSSRRRTRKTLKIPDDAVPATPAPAAVAPTPAEAPARAEEPVPSSVEELELGEPEAEEAPVPPPTRPALPSSPGRLATPPPPPPPREPTPAKEHAEAAPHEAAPPAPPPSDEVLELAPDEVEPAAPSLPPAALAERSEPTPEAKLAGETPAAGPPPKRPSGVIPAVRQQGDPGLSSAGASGKGGPGVLADSASVTLIRPIEVSSDLPPVEARPPKPAPITPPPQPVPSALTEAGATPPATPPATMVPSISSASPAGASSGPTTPSSTPALPPPAAPSAPAPTQRRPLPPPPRKAEGSHVEVVSADALPEAEPDEDAIEEIEPDRMSLPTAAGVQLVDIKLADQPPASGDATGLSPSSKRVPPPPRRGLPTPVVDVDIDDEPVDATAAAAPTPEAVRTPAPRSEPGAAVAAAPQTVPTPAVTPPPPAAATAPTPIQPTSVKPAAPKEAAPSRSPESEPKPETKPKAWWAELFDEDFARTLDRLQAPQVEREAAFVEQSLGLEAGARILDLGCGEGQIAVELARRGYELVGVDRSAAMLGMANGNAQAASQPVNFVQGDMRQLDLDAMFDGIYCWHQSFGYFGNEDNANVLVRVHRALRRGGMFLLDVTNRDYVAPRQPTMAWFTGRDCVCMDEMRFDFFTSRMSVKRMVMFRTGKSREVEFSMRLYCLHELGELLHAAGFKVVEVSGHIAHRGAFFGYESPRIVILSERA
ncbi:MAG: methyltransferase domain-containing protein [Myxococcales bacterium]|nr:methyltransferase domain-containing protein [Myxococcales bacterium]